MVRIHFWQAKRDALKNIFQTYYLIDSTDQESPKGWVDRCCARIRKRILLMLLIGGGPFLLMVIAGPLWASTHAPVEPPVWFWVLAGCISLAMVLTVLAQGMMTWFMNAMRTEAQLAEYRYAKGNQKQLHQEDQSFLKNLFGDSIITEDDEDE